MEFSFVTALIGSVVALGVLSASFTYLSFVVRGMSELRWWAAGCAAAALDYLSIMLASDIAPGLFLPLQEGLHIFFVSALLIGVLRLLGRPVPYLLLLSIGIVMVAIGVVSTITNPSFLLRSLPLSITAAGMTVYAGYLLLRQSPEYGEPGYAFAGVAFLLWSVVRFSYSFLAPVPWFAPWGYMAAHTFAMAMAIGLIITVLEKLRHHALAAEATASLEKERAEQASRAKTRFLAAASHDLRQPLQAMTFFTATLTGAKDEAERHNIAEKIERSLSALGGLVNSMLDISKLEAGLVVPDKRTFPLGPMIEKLAHENGLMAENKDIRLCSVATSAWTNSDPALIETILQNLLSNAVKYTDSGKILVGVRRRGANIRIEVCDTGRGIPLRHIETIFEDFQQLPAAKADQRPGLGLGLSIVNRLARLLGHKITVQSKPGKGSVFALEVPLAQATSEGASSSEKSPASLSGMRVVVIEDDPEVLESLDLLLTHWGANVTTHDPSTGTTEAHILSTDPDIIISDYGLIPGTLTGVEMIEKIRRSTGRKIPSLLITGDTSGESLKIIEKSGIRSLHKPVAPDTLRKAIDSLLG
ncbi:MAG: ATP-binding protein [Rhodospirillales bacterium]|nr:ATP-binding protein [Rhodospirillales bacterium]MCW8861470.1 ATP-binding protein [Rhodospirillales bacterium]MCW9003284.1 ATP-binding protein [Rhodospirillales bacterium]